LTKIDKVQEVAKPFLHVVGETRNDVPTVEDKEIADVVRSLTGRAKSLYHRESGDGEDRSARLYELGALVREMGVSPEVQFAVLQRSPWNKFQGRDDEAVRLWEAVERSRDGVRALPRGPRGRHRLSRAQSVGTLLARNTVPTEWCVEGIWEHRGWGFIAGEPKTYKSTFATDLAVSVATAAPFLGHFHVSKPSPVLIIQEENSENIQHARLARILRSKGYGGEVHSLDGSILEMTPPDGDCPVYCLDRTRFSFNNAKKRRALEADIKAIQPGLVIFDPLQRMMGELSIRNEKDVTYCLDWLDKVGDSYKTGLLIVHHYNKGREDGPKEGGQRMLGSQALHAWLTCGIYIQRVNGGHLKVTREFRAFDSGQPFELEFDSQDDEDFYDVTVHETPKATTKKQDELLDLVAEQQWLTADEYAKLLGVSRRTAGERLQRLGCVKKRKKAREGGRPKVVFGNPPKPDAKTG
jgi:hypothetical protein